MIQKLHLQVYLQLLRSKAIELYLEYSSKLTTHIIHHQIKQKYQKYQVLIQLKDVLSKIQIELQDNEQIKYKSFIVAEKLLSTMKLNVKCYQNVGVTCDILKNDQVNREILKLLSQKRITNSKDNLDPYSSQIYPASSMIQQPTNDHILAQNKQQKHSAVHISSHHESHSQKNRLRQYKSQQKIQPNNQKKQDQFRSQIKNKYKSPKDEDKYLIKRSKTDIAEELESQEENKQCHATPVKIKDSRVKEKNSSNQRTQRPQIKHTFSSEIIYRPQTQRQFQQNYQQSNISNQNNIGMIDIKVQGKSLRNQIYEVKPYDSNNRILPSQFNSSKSPENSYQVQQEPTSPKILPAGVQISKIVGQRIQPHQMNFSNFSNPLISSTNLMQSKILPASLYMSEQKKQQSIPQRIKTLNQQLSANSLSQNLQQIPKMYQLSNVTQVVSHVNQQKQKVIEQNQFNSESSIQNKLQVSINESEYSDMFDSGEENEEEGNLEIKVEAVVENIKSEKNIKPRLDICNIQLYDNAQVRFLSIYDKVMFEGKLRKMLKIPDNYYQLFIQQKKQRKEDSPAKQIQNTQKNPSSQTQTIKKVKFRGQAKPFMKYLQKLVKVQK